jgi:hypothetical protein
MNRLDGAGSPPHRVDPRLLLAGILLVLLALKIAHHSAGISYEPDPSLYQDIAGHVRDGHGLVTDASLFNAGFSYFPHPTPLYPLWPLILGYCSRILPLESLAIWLPTLCYFATLLLAYRLAARLLPGPLFPGLAAPGPHAGHAAVLVLGLTNSMFFSTSQPFTEGPAYLLLLLALTRTHALCARPGALRGLEVGAWMGLLVLCRSQLALAPLALGAALGWAVLRLGARRYAPVALAFAAGFMAVLGPQMWHISSFTAGPPWVYMLRFDLYREPSSLPPLQIMVATDGPWEYFKDRLSGLPVAFGFGSSSYLHTFAGWALALPLALPFALRDGWLALRTRGLPALWRRMHGPAALFWIFLAALTAAGLLSLHTIHKAWFNEWNFGTRHALTAVFALLAALLYLARRPGLARLLALLLLCGASLGGALRIVHFIQRPQDPRGSPLADVGDTGELEIVAWLESRAAAEPGLRVAAPDIEIQHLARLGDGVGYHWFYRTFTWDELQVLFDELGARYLLLRVDAPAMAFQQDGARFDRGFEPVITLSSFTVFRRRGAGPP